MDESAQRTRVEWREWGEEAFAVADRAGKPVLLSLSATWCDACHEMDRESYDEPRIAANINDSVVPIRVDVDRNPRVRERYAMGGFPSTVFLTPEGEILTGAGALGPDGVRQALDSVRKMWNAKGIDAGRVPRALRDQEPPAGPLTPAIEEHIAGQVDEQYDRQHAGWGTEEKFPLPETIEFALKRNRNPAIETLSAVERSLFDEHDGGFYRMAGTRRWTEPHREKLLDENAALLRAFANGYLYTGRERFREVADRTIEYLTTTLWSGDGFAGSQAPGESESVDGSPSDREAADEPPVDETVFADRNALAAEALLTVAAYTDDDRASRYADRALDAVADLRDGDALLHYRDGDETGDRGLLLDHARAVEALTTAAQVRGDERYVERAETLVEFVVDERRDEDGTFLDGSIDGIGLCARPLRPLDDAVVLADGLIDLAALTGENRYREIARDALESFAGAYERFGPQVARYGAVTSRLIEGTLTIAVATPPGSDLHRAALRMADHEKIVVPNAEGDEYEPGHAYVHRADELAGSAATPEELSELVRNAA